MPYGPMDWDSMLRAMQAQNMYGGMMQGGANMAMQGMQGGGMNPQAIFQGLAGPGGMGGGMGRPMMDPRMIQMMRANPQMMQMLMARQGR